MSKRIRKCISLVLSLTCAFAMAACPAYADSSRVVTIGADLTEDDRNMILDYFGISGENVPTITVNNQEERDHLAEYVPLEQIGTRTYSCSYVSPTDEGGIQVKTANLTYVTSSMIASALATSGVSNCDVIAASPFPVSGTGALTGILMAYEKASDEELDEEKKDAAMQELVTTAEIGDDTDQNLAAWLVNELKKEVMDKEGLTEDDVRQIVDDALEEYGVSLSDEDRQMLYDLMEKISGLEYDLDSMKETLDRVEQNVAESVNNNPDVSITIDNSSESSGNSTTVSDDSILSNTNDSIMEGAESDSTYDAGFDIVVQDAASITEADGVAEEAEEETEEETEEKSSGFFESVADGIAEGVSDFIDGLTGAGNDDGEAEDDGKAEDESDDGSLLDGIIDGLTDGADSFADTTVTFEDLVEEETEELTEADEEDNKDSGECSIIRITPNTVYIDAPGQEIAFTMENAGDSDIGAILAVDSDLFNGEEKFAFTIPADGASTFRVAVEDVPDEGSAEIAYVLTLEDGTMDSGSVTIDIEEPEEAELAIGEELHLKEDSDEDETEEEDEAEWNSSDESVATADDGIVRAVGEGKAFISEECPDGSVVIWRITVSDGSPLTDEGFFVEYGDEDAF